MAVNEIPTIIILHTCLKSKVTNLKKMFGISIGWQQLRTLRTRHQCQYDIFHLFLDRRSKQSSQQHA